jgi:hypothetical protein
LTVPHFLVERGYEEIPAVQSLEQHVHVHPKFSWTEPRWWPWRGIFDYLSCVEFAREFLHTVPTGRELGGGWILPVQYHSVSLVFFAQAGLDNIAVWLRDEFKFKAKGSDCAFHKHKFLAGLTEKAPAIAQAIEAERKFLDRLNRYRNEWVHRMSGGARIYSDKPPSDPTAQIQVLIPIDPTMDQHLPSNFDKYTEQLERTRKANAGREFYSAAEFADLIADGTKRTMLSVLEQGLVALPEISKTPEAWLVE